jgi:hypothetical protein
MAHGRKTGGRHRGTPNKATIEKALIAARTVAGAKLAAKKLAKEVLEDFMLLFAGMAAHHQPTPPGHPQNPHESKTEFLRYAGMAIDCAHKLAPYQSPTFRAVMVAPAPDANAPEKRKRFTLTIFQGGKPDAA